ncbi:MAG: Fic family protein [Flavobacteriaceae bacterium]
MTEIINVDDKKITILTSRCVKELHQLLSDNYGIFKGMEPISPAGVKNNHLLESAVFRQQTGSGKYYKYDDCFLNCATLAYGITKNHAFHNGNKRLGLLSIIKHLHVNGLVLRPRLSENELYDLMLNTVENQLRNHARKHQKNYENIVTLNWSDDMNIDYLAYWLRLNSLKKYNYTGIDLKIRDFKKILEKKEIEYKEEGRNIILTKYKRGFLGLLKKPMIRKKYLIGTKKLKIRKFILEKFRKDFNLTKSDGIDNVSFYDESSFLNEEIIKYKSIIYRLSKT